MKVFIINGNSQYNVLFKSLGYSLTDNLDEANLVVFTGGADVSPRYYGDKQHPFTGSDLERDDEEAIMFHSCINKNIPMVGICRGSQFLNVMSGGRMYQHVSEHCGSHHITDLETGDTVFVSSTHHQMIMPSPEAILVASSRLGGTREWYDGEIFKKDVSGEDIEVVYYPKTNALCFQPHPEFPGKGNEGMFQYFKSLLERYLIKEMSHG